MSSSSSSETPATAAAASTTTAATSSSSATTTTTAATSSATTATTPAAEPTSAVALMAQYGHFPSNNGGAAAAAAASAAGEEPEHVRNLIVNYLPFSVTEQMLHTMFVPYGTIERAKLMTEPNGQSKCFGFVKFSTSTAANAAVAALDGREIDGKRVRVSLARPDGVNPAQRRTAAQQVMGAASMVAALSEVNLYVSGLAPHVTRELLREAFSAFGVVTDASVLTDPGSAQNKGIGFVRYGHVHDADRAIAALDGQTPPAIAAKPLNVRIADSTKRAMGVGGPMRNPLGMGAVAAAAAMRFSPYGAFPGGANPAMYNPALLAGGGMAAYQQQLAGAAAAGQQAAAAAAAAAAAYGGGNPGAMAMFGGMPPQAFAGAMGLPGAAAAAAVPSASGTVGVPLFVHGVPREADEAWLTQVFSPYGQVLQVRIVRDPQTNVSKGFGFAHLPTLNEAYAAIAAVNGATVNGKVLTVSLKQAKS